MTIQRTTPPTKQTAQGVPTLQPQRAPDLVPENSYQLFTDDRAVEYDQTHCYGKDEALEGASDDPKRP
jgi:hypothetical protein